MTKQKILLRRFQAEDADRLSRLIIRSLRVVSSREYSMETIEALITFFTPDKLIEMARAQYMIVCVRDDDIVGVASLDGNRVRNVFVDADLQRKGIGKLLMSGIEAHPNENNQTNLYLYSALSAQGFYEALGYRATGMIDRHHNGYPLPVVKMEK
jgi:GNAT superfamily N-acetyltransferase